MRWSLALLPLLIAAAGASAQLPESSLSVDTGKGWETWWRSESAPIKWAGPSAALQKSLRWKQAQRGVEYAELRLSGTGEAWRIRIVVVRIDAEYVRGELVRMTRDQGTLGAWSVDSIPPGAILAVNAGQFSSGHPWGWLVRNGVEEQPPAVGPLSLAFTSDRNGFFTFNTPEIVELVRGTVPLAFQSYPTLLEYGGVVPEAVRAEGRGLDVAHRDSRVAMGQLRDGRIIVALTRFEALGGVLSQLPFGPTVPEMSALMGALGCSVAVSLDGGLSGQLALRTPDGVRYWRGLRRVPLALVFFPRQ